LAFIIILSFFYVDSSTDLKSFSMRRVIFILILAVNFISDYGQAPSSFNYQAIVRDGSGSIIPSRTVSFRLGILEGSEGGSSVYTEKHVTATDDFGLVHLQVGKGIYVSGNFANIDWSSSEFFIKIEIDIDGGEDFTVMGTSQLISVPYSLFSETSGNSLDTQNLEGVLRKGNDANFQRINNLLIGNCIKCDATTKGCIRYDTIEKKIQICNGEEWIDLITSATGLPNDAVYVSPNGADTAGAGARKSPCRTITYAIGVAVSEVKPQVLVANGLYNETLTLVNGISLLGGYDPVTWSRNLDASYTMVSGTDYLNNHPVTIMANNINQSTLFQGFIIYGSDAVISGYNSYAVYINGSNSELNLSDNKIYCGKGASGTVGNPGENGLSGTTGTGRDVNPSGYDAFITSSSNCNSSNNRQYSNGGVLSVSGDNISGGNGGGNKCPPSGGAEFSGIDGFAGQAGSATRDGAAGIGGDAGDDGEINSGICYVPGSSMVGNNGSNGGDGLNGPIGAGGLISLSVVLSEHWTGARGSNGGLGGNGGGGGGGGAGGGGDCISGCTGDRLGGHGGGGGSGGGGGTGGYGGSSGGGSFGIFIVNSASPGITNTSVFRGNGGNGGTGGQGGVGGVGGAGGNGGICPGSCLCFMSAGKGGNGGNGGHGGGGGGGTGGSSIGIYSYNSTIAVDYQNVELKNSFTGGTAGTGGAGGLSYGGYGGTGQNGLLLACSYN